MGWAKDGEDPPPPRIAALYSFLNQAPFNLIDLIILGKLILLHTPGALCPY